MNFEARYQIKTLLPQNDFCCILKYQSNFALDGNLVEDQVAKSYGAVLFFNAPHSRCSSGCPGLLLGIDWLSLLPQTKSEWLHSMAD